MVRNRKSENCPVLTLSRSRISIRFSGLKKKKRFSGL